MGLYVMVSHGVVCDGLSWAVCDGLMGSYVMVSHGLYDMVCRRIICGGLS